MVSFLTPFSKSNSFRAQKILTVCTSALLAVSFATQAKAGKHEAKGSGHASKAEHSHDDSKFFSDKTIGKLALKQHSNLFLSGAPSQTDVVAMKKEGFVAIVDIRQASEDRSALEKAAKDAGIAYHNVPLFAGPNKAIDASAVDAITGLHKKYHDAPHVVACASGNRSSAWFAAHVGRDHGLAADKAIAAGRTAFLRDDMASAVGTFLTAHGQKSSRTH